MRARLPRLRQREEKRGARSHVRLECFEQLVKDSKKGEDFALECAMGSSVQTLTYSLSAHLQSSQLHHRTAPAHIQVAKSPVHRASETASLPKEPCERAESQRSRRGERRSQICCASLRQPHFHAISSRLSMLHGSCSFLQRRSTVASKDSGLLQRIKCSRVYRAWHR